MQDLQEKVLKSDVDRQLVQDLREEVKELKRRRSSPAEGGGSGNTRHPKARRGSKGSPIRARPEKRGPSSSPPSGLDSNDDDLGSDEWSSSDDEAKRRAGGRGYRGAQHRHRRLSAPARGRGAMEQGFYPYGAPPGGYPYPAPMFFPPMYPGYGGGGYAPGMPMGMQVSVAVFSFESDDADDCLRLSLAVAVAGFLLCCAETEG